MTTKHPLVVFSGGMDSTYMLWEELKKGNVYTCYFTAGQHHYKAEKEIEQRSKIISMLESLTGNSVIEDTIVRLGGYMGIEMVQTRRRDDYVTHDTNNPPDFLWSQANKWLFAALYVSNGRSKHSSIMIGNVMGDDITVHQADQIAAWKHLQAFTKSVPIPLEFPLTYVTKRVIFPQMPLDLLELIWVCELPEKSDLETHACGECHACMDQLVQVWLDEHHRHWEHSKSFKEYMEKRREQLNNNQLIVTDDHLKPTPPAWGKELTQITEGAPSES